MPKENFDHEFIAPRSPLSFNSSTYMSPHVLPPLKFHSGLVGPHNTVTVSLGSNDEDDDDSDDDESVASVPNDPGGNYSEEEGLRYSDVESLEKSVEKSYDNDMFGSKLNKNLNQSTVFGLEGGQGSTLNKGLLMEDLRIEVPKNYRRFTDGVLGFGMRGAHLNTESGGSCRLHERIQLHNAYGTPISNGMRNDVTNLGTPSAPPTIDIGREGNKSEAKSELREDFGGLTEMERSFDAIHLSKELEDGYQGDKEAGSDWRVQSQKDEHVERENKTVAGEKEAPAPYWQTNSFDNSPHYDASGQNAWQTLIAYHACIRLCLNAWARGFTEAPEFLRNECLVLRSAFRLQVRKLRVIPTRKLKSTYSLRSAMYMQVGVEYVRHVSSLVKTSINSLKIASLSVTSEERLSCLFHLKSSTEDTQDEQGSAICLRPGIGDYHVL
ncbi:unnamed protein product [Camellia sinensis]